MTETVETVEQESWLIRNLYWIFFIGAFISHGFVSEWVSFPVYIIAVMLIYANVLFFISKNKNSNKQWFVARNWLKTNLIFLATMGISFFVFFGGVNLLERFAKFVPESASAVFSGILVTGVILYLIGVGFYLVEKTTKN